MAVAAAGPLHAFDHVEQQRQRPLQVRRPEPVGVERLQVFQRPLDVAGQEQQLPRADPAAHQGRLVRFRGERHRLGGELGGRGVRGPRVRGLGGRVQRVRDLRVRPGPAASAAKCAYRSGLVDASASRR